MIKKLAYLAAALGGAMFLFDAGCGWWNLGGEKTFVITGILNELLFS